MNDYPSADLPDEHPLSRASRAENPVCPLDALVAAAVERLKMRLPPQVLVDAFPDKPDEFDFPGAPAAALVIYDGSKFDRGGLPGEAGLLETVRLVIVLLVRSQRGDNGAHALLHEVRSALHGVSLGGSSGLLPIDVALERQSQGVFQYRCAFDARIPAVPTKHTGGIALPNRR